MSEQFSLDELVFGLETLSQRARLFRKAIKEGKVKQADLATSERKAEVLESLAAKFKTLEEEYRAAHPEEEKSETILSPDTNILLIDDDDCSRDILKSMLEEMGLKKVQEAEKGSDGLEQLRGDGAEIDLVLCDWQMPGITGLELLQMVRSDDKLKKLPFIMVTGVGDVEYIQDAIKSGVSDYIVKPIDMDVLQTKLSKLSM